jgi:polyhydroxyalkanoate synthesis regulator phasin
MKTKGQSLSEVSLVASILAVLLLSSLAVFNQQFALGMQSTAAKLMPAKSGGIVTASNALTIPPVQTVPKQTLLVQLEDGSQLSLSGFPVSDTAMVEVSGMSGLTNAYASTLQQLVDQLVAAGKLTSEQSQSLIDLSNQGFRLSRIQAAIEEAIKNNAGKLVGDLNKVMLTVDGETQPLSYWRKQVNGNGVAAIHSGDTYDFTTPESLIHYSDAITPNMGGYHRDFHLFMTRYKEAFDDGSLTEPAVQSVVEQLVFNIAYNSDSVSNHLWTDSRTTDSIPKAYLSDVSAKSSGHICDVGNGNNTGISCTN